LVCPCRVQQALAERWSGGFLPAEIDCNASLKSDLA